MGCCVSSEPSAVGDSGGADEAPRGATAALARAHDTHPNSSALAGRVVLVLGAPGVGCHSLVSHVLTALKLPEATADGCATVADSDKSVRQLLRLLAKRRSRRPPGSPPSHFLVAPRPERWPELLAAAEASRAVALVCVVLALPSLDADAVQFWEEVANLREFAATPFALVLHQRDLAARGDVAALFPGFVPRATDAGDTAGEAAELARRLHFLRARLEELDQSPHPRTALFTSLADTDSLAPFVELVRTALKL